MTGQELISQAIQFYDNTSPGDAENANRRLRVLHYAQLVLDEVWNWRSWPFKHTTGTVVCSGGEGVLPSNFCRFGSEGLVFETTPQASWTEAFLGDVKSLQLRGSSQARLFSVSACEPGATLYTGVGSVGLGDTTITFDPVIPGVITLGDSIDFDPNTETMVVSSRVDDNTVVAQAVSTLGHSLETCVITRPTAAATLVIPDVGTRTLTVLYEKNPPTVADSTALLGIPAAYHSTVLLAGTVARLQTSKNDLRVQQWEAQYRMGLGRMVVNEMPMASRMKQMPSSGGNRC